MVKSKTNRASMESNSVISKDKLKDFVNKNRAKQYGWALGHLYPDIYQPQRFPDQYKFPTHVMTNKRQRTLTIPSTKDFGIYFCPIADCFYNYKLNQPNEPYHGLNTPWHDVVDDEEVLVDGRPISNAYVSYADNDSQATSAPLAGKQIFDSAGSEKFNDVLKWNYTEEGSPSITKFKKIRLIGAAIKITYTGKAEDLSGLVKVAMGVKGFASKLTAENVKLEELHNFPSYQSFTMEKSIVCRYRMTHDDFTEFGPYTPYSALPFYIIYGKGLQPGSTVFVEIIKHFEGVVIPGEEEFVSPVRASNDQLPLDSQMDLVSNYKEDGHIEEFDDMTHKEMRSMME